MLDIAFLQIMPADTQAQNLSLGIEACEAAKYKGADIALFPEMWSTGYRIPSDKDELQRAAVSVDSEFVTAFSDTARRLDMAVGISFLERHSSAPRNSFCLFDRHGELKLKYSKVHTCKFGDEKVLCGGDDFYVADLDTRKGNVRVGAMICYDREFPESARILMLKGAELILVPNACPMEINRLAQLRARAFENMTAIATCNYPHPQPDCNGHSTLFDGVAYLPDLKGSRDTCVFEAVGTEGVFIARLDLDMLRSYRKAEVHGNKYRVPDKYGLLTKSIDDWI